ncbi:MAG: hypothetical protein ACK4K9_02615 [Bacteroidia bacterium]
MQNKLFKPILSLHYLSVDVAFGAFVNSYFINKIFDIQYNLELSFCLFCSVLIIYWFDHYLDTLNKGFNVIDERHEFVLKHKTKLAFASVLLSIFVCVIIYSVGVIKLIKVILISTISLFSYFLLANKRIISKEFMVSSIYALGITGLALLQNINQFVLLFYIMIFLVTVQNMLMINIKEWSIDKQNNSSNLRWVFSEIFIMRVSFFLFFSTLLLFGILFIYKPENTMILYGFCLVLNGLVQQVLTHTQIKYYRVIGEAAYCIPVILFLL